MCARILARHANLPRRISVEQLLDEPWGRRRPCMRRVRRRVRSPDDARSACALAGQRADAEHLAGCPAGRARLPESPVHDDRHRRRGAVRRADLRPEHRGGVRLRDRRPAVRLDRVHRDERLGALQRARRRGRARRRHTRAASRLPRRRDHRPAGRRTGADRRGGLLRGADLVLQRQPEDGGRRADRARLRRLADLGLRASRRRDLHEGGRRRRRPRGQGRGGHSRGRSAQPGDDRRQRGRQRRRLRRHGGRPVRDLRGHRGRGDPARRAYVQPVHAGWRSTRW